jgi:hypothetical protein
MDIVLAFVVKGKKSGKPRREQKTGGDHSVQSFMDLVPILLAY